MKIIQNRKEWRHEVVLRLVERGLGANDAIDEAKMIEEYVFQDSFIVEVPDIKQREALKAFIESFQSKDSSRNCINQSFPESSSNLGNIGAKACSSDEVH